MLALITGWTSDIAKWFIGVGSAVWVWWLSPLGSPFILLVTITAIGMKMLFNKIKDLMSKKKKEKDHYKSCPYKLEPVDQNDNPEYIPTKKEEDYGTQERY